jgi:hypothetical protein
MDYIKRLDKIADFLEGSGQKSIAEQLDLVTNGLENQGLTQPLSTRRDYGSVKKADLGEEKEIRILLSNLPKSVLSDDSTEKTSIHQGFICVGEGGTDVRIRKEVSSDGKETFTMTAKCRPENHEAETEISKEIFENLWPKAKGRVFKDRYRWNGFDIDDISEGENKGQAAGEVWAEYEYSGNPPKVSDIVGKDWKIVEE